MSHCTCIRSEIEDCAQTIILQGILILKIAIGIKYRNWQLIVSVIFILRTGSLDDAMRCLIRQKSFYSFPEFPAGLWQW